MTEVGRAMVLDGQLRPTKEHLLNSQARGQLEQPLVMGNPDKKPASSDELVWLVTLAIWLASIINSKFGAWIQRHYERRTFLGIFLKQVLCPPSRYYLFVDKSPTVFSLPPRVSFRSIASIQLQVYFWSCILVFTLLGYPIAFSMFFPFVVLTTYWLVKSLLVYACCAN